jgi:catechol 2,3-dioxygenase-like lactoylglutathione lyase family enzyme
MTAKPRITGLGHVGLHASDPAALTEFYRTVLGLQIVGQVALTAEGLRSSVFLSSRPADTHYQVTIFENAALLKGLLPPARWQGFPLPAGCLSGGNDMLGL